MKTDNGLKELLVMLRLPLLSLKLDVGVSGAGPLGHFGEVASSSILGGVVGKERGLSLHCDFSSRTAGLERGVMLLGRISNLWL